MSETQMMTFEKAYERLEAILEKLNSGQLTLDESIKLYEEADKLLQFCSKTLTDAEKKIEVLMKTRSGDVAVGSDGKPTTKNFELS